MIRILLADDHAIVRDGIKQLFALVDDVGVVAEAVHGGEVMESLRQGDIDLLLLDMTMPGICGDDLIARVRSQHANLPILVFSMHNEPQIVQRALTAGANGYITKDSDPQTLFAAVHKVASGGRFVDSAIAEQSAFAIGGPSATVGHGLTE